MESIILSFNAVLPIFILMAIGYVIRGLKVTDKKGFDAVNKLVFKVFLPVLLFKNIYKTESLQVFDVKLIIFTIITVLIIFVLGNFAVLKLADTNPKRGVMLQGFFRANYAILGVPLVDYICGENGGGLASLMVAIVVPVFNVLAVICLERFRGGSTNFKKLLKGVVTNPLIIGCFIGVIFLLTGIKLPPLIEGAVGDVAKIATPLSLIGLGASFTFSGIKGYWRENAIILSAKLVIIPLIALLAAVAIGFRGEALACLLVVFGSPVAVSSFAMSQQMGGDENLAAQAVVLSSAFCLVTLFLWIFVLDSMGLFF